MGAFGEDQRGAVRYLAALREHWLLIASIVVLAVAAAVAYVETATPQYDAESDVLVTPLSSNDTSFLGFSLLREGTDASRAILTAARFVRTPQVAKLAAQKLGTTQAAALAGVTVTPVTQSGLVAISGSSANPERAAAIANAFADALVGARTAEFHNELSTRIHALRMQLAAIPPAQRPTSASASALESQLGALTSLVGSNDPTLQVLARATPPLSPSSPRKTLSVGVAFLASLILGCGLALALELVSPRINREDDLLLEQRLPILARVPRMPAKVMRGYLTGREPLPPAVREAYRTLRATLTSGSGDSFPHTLVVTSASPGEGKTLTSVNLATTLAVGGQRVVLVDGDLRRPMVATVFGVAARRNGFATALTGESSLDDALVEAPGYGDRLRLLLASPDHAYLVDLLDAARIESVLADLRLEADVVVIDSPPLTEVADALALADASEGVIVAVRLGRTRRDKLAELRRMLARQGVSPLGFVVTQRRRVRPGAYHTTYGNATGDEPVLPSDPPVRDPEAV